MRSFIFRMWEVGFVGIEEGGGFGWCWCCVVRLLLCLFMYYWRGEKRERIKRGSYMVTLVELR